MDTLIHADIFFFITSIAVVFSTGAFLVAVWYVIQILRDIRQISIKAKDAAGKLEGDFNELREEMKRKGGKVSSMADMILAFFTSLIPRPKKKKTQKSDVV